MPRNYEPEFKKKIVRLHLEEGRTYASIREEYGISKSAISSWCNEFSKECQKQADIDNAVKTDLDIMKENLRLRKEPEEMKKENLMCRFHPAFCR